MKQRIFFVAICVMLATAWQAGGQDAVTYYGSRALRFPSGDRDLNAYIEYASMRGRPVAKGSLTLRGMAFRSGVLHDHRGRCAGSLFVSRSGIQYHGTNDKHEFDVPWTQIEEVKRSGKKGDPRITVRWKKKDYHFRLSYIDMEDNWIIH